MNQYFRTRDHALALFRSVAVSPVQSAVFFAVLAVITLLAPASDVIWACGSLGMAFFLARVLSGAMRKKPIIFGDASSQAGHANNNYQFATDADGDVVKITQDALRQHMLYVGDTESGKTEALLGLCANALAQDSGFLFVDGKGDVSLFGKIYALARRFGREDDVLVLSFMTSNADVRAGGGTILSNTLNPFTTGSSDSLTQMVVSLMDEVGDNEGAMWKGRATALFTGVMRALVWKREAGLLDLNIGVIRDHLNLNRIIDMADKESEPDMPANIRSSIEAYLSSLPGFQRERGNKQGQTTKDQHGFLQMQFTKVLGNLADVYGHIFLSHGEIDMTDVVLNRRILVVMLPALEKSTDEVANLGKIVVATLKGMMSSTLGSRIEGEWDRVIEARPYNAKSNYLVVLDDVGYYCVDGLAIMSAQARGLGFSLVFASQDIPAMMRENDKEAKSIIANTGTKVFMRVTDTKHDDRAARPSRVWSRYFDDMEDRTAAADRLTPHDLRTLAVGEAIVTWRDQMFKLALFSVFPELDFANIRSLQLRANHFVRVRSPDPEDLGERQRPDYPLRNCGTVGKNVDIDFDLIFEKDARLGKKN